MKKFDIYSWIYEQVEAEKDEQMEQNQNSVPNQNADISSQNQEVPQQSPPETTPVNVNSQSQSKNAFRSIIGGTIGDISFEAVGSQGGKLTITTSNSHIPLVVSWVNQKVSVQQPDGNVIMLSQDEVKN